MAPLSILLAGCGSGSGSSSGPDTSSTDGNSATVSDSNSPARTDVPTGDFEGDSTQPIRYLGIVDVELRRDNLGVSGAFLELERPMTLEELAATDGLGLDSCEIRYGTTPEIFFGPGFDEPAPEGRTTFVSAGDALVLSSPQGTLATIRSTGPFGESFFFGYETEDEEPVPGPIPDSLTLSISGDTFPAFSEVVIPDWNPPVLIGDRLELGSLDKPLRWEAGNPNESFLTLELRNHSYDVSGAEVLCRVQDDGEFALPLQAQTALSGEAILFFMNYRRDQITRRQSGDAILSIYTSSQF